MSRHEEEAGVEKSRDWQNMIREAARRVVGAGVCRRRQLPISRLYWWQRRLKPQQTSARRKQRAGSGQDPASFALVSENGQSAAAGIFHCWLGFQATLTWSVLLLTQWGQLATAAVQNEADLAAGG